MRLQPFLATLVAVCSSFASAASTFSPARPPSIPLAVKSPYLNTWLDGPDHLLPGAWPVFWTKATLGWQGFVRVDGTTWNWMGAAPGPATVEQVSFTYTSTKSTFVFNVDGKVKMTVLFFTPVYPNNIDKQSLQFSYVHVKVSSTDGSSHSVQVYMDLSGEFTGDPAGQIKWSFDTQGDLAYHSFERADQDEFGETNDAANWGTWYLATTNSDSVSYRSGADTTVRPSFESDGKLDNTVDENFRAVNDDWPVFALSVDLGDVASDEASTLFTLGLSQDKVINFLGPGGKGADPVSLAGLWSAYYSNGTAALESFHSDFKTALSDGEELDEKIAKDAKAVGGDDYVTITSLSLRQTFGAMQFAGTDEEPYIFLKEISSNSDIQTVDVFFPAAPVLFYLNPKLIKMLLEPIYVHTENDHWPKDFTIHDLGTYPNAIGHTDGNSEEMPLEECGNMIILSLGYAQRTEDKDYLSTHWDTLHGWAQYLIEYSEKPEDQLSTDDFAGTLANQTNLAIKGIIGLKAMSEIAKLLSKEDIYGDVADQYLESWQGFGINKEADPPHTVLTYNDKETHGILYNIYSDKLLSLNFIPDSIYDMQSDFYPTVRNKYGVPLDTRHGYTKSDWEMWAAAVCGPATRQMFIEDLAKWIGETPTTRALTDLFETDTGAYPASGLQFTARPVQGGVFSLLALPELPGGGGAGSTSGSGSSKEKKFYKNVRARMAGSWVV